MFQETKRKKMDVCEGIKVAYSVIYRAFQDCEGLLEIYIHLFESYNIYNKMYINYIYNKYTCFIIRKYNQTYYIQV